MKDENGVGCGIRRALDRLARSPKTCQSRHFSSGILPPSSSRLYHLRFLFAAKGRNSRDFDAGFVETCRMAPADIRRVILNILERIAPDEDLSNLDDARPLREQMELDSMDFLDIVMELRKRHRIQIPEDDYINLASMDSTVTYLEPLLKDAVRAK
jgi:acyl carrier protein